MPICGHIHNVGGQTRSQISWSWSDRLMQLLETNEWSWPPQAISSPPISFWKLMSVSAGPCLSKAALLWWIFGEILASPVHAGLTWGERAPNKNDGFYMLFQYERWHAGERASLDSALVFQSWHVPCSGNLIVPEGLINIQAGQKFILCNRLDLLPLFNA